MRTPRVVKHILSGTAFMLVLVGLGNRSMGGAFEVLQQSARASGQAEAFAAQADDPSAIWYNPAGIAQLRGTRILAGGYLVIPDYHFSGPAGEASNHEKSFLPELYVTSDLGLSRFSFGLGLNNVFGLKEDWGRNSPLETLFTRGHLSVLNLQPTVAFKVTDNLSVGVGLNIYYGSANLERKQVLGPPPTPLGNFRLHGDDVAFGVSPGVLWKIDEHNTVAAFYHSPFTLNLEGRVDITGKGLPAIGPADATTTLKMPQIAGIAYAIRPITPWKIEADAVWSNWSTLQEIPIESPNKTFNGQAIPTKYHDTWSFRLGTQVDLDAHWSVRGGYAYGTSASPAQYFSPIVPDSNYHLFSVGLGYATDAWSLDFAYLFILRETRNIGGGINAPAVVGSYNTNMQGLILNLGLKL